MFEDPKMTQQRIPHASAYSPAELRLICALDPYEPRTLATVVGKVWVGKTSLLPLYPIIDRLKGAGLLEVHNEHQPRRYVLSKAGTKVKDSCTPKSIPKS